MRAYVLQNELINVLDMARKVAGTKSRSTFLQAIWIKAEGQTLTISSTDGDMEYTAQVPARVDEEGIAGVGEQVASLVNKLPAGEITLDCHDDVNGQSFGIFHERLRYKLPVYDPSWFQPMDSVADVEYLRITAKDLRDLFGRVLFCASDDLFSEALNCVRIYQDGADENDYAACAMNGHQMGMYSTSDDNLGFKDLLLENRHIKEIMRFTKSIEPHQQMLIFAGPNRFFVSYGYETISCPIKSYEFPDLDQIIVKAGNNVSLKVYKEDFLNSLERLSIFITDSCQVVRFSFQDEKLFLSMSNSEKGNAHEDVPAACRFNTHDFSEVHLPIKTLIEIVKHLSGDNVVMNFVSAEGPVTIKAMDDEFFYVLLMPVLIGEPIDAGDFD